MALNYQQPSFLQPTDYSGIPKGIDELFNAYQRAKQNNRLDVAAALENQIRQQQISQNADASKLRDVSQTAQFGAPLRTYTPEQIQQYSQPGAAPQGPGLPADQAKFQQLAQGLHAVGQQASLESRLKESEIAKNLGTAGDSHYNVDQAASLFSTSQDPAEVEKSKAALTHLFPGGRIPKDFVHQAATNNRLNVNVGEKQSQFDAKRLTSLGDALDPSKARAGAFGVSKQVFDRAERLQSLAGAFRDNNLDSRQTEELAIGLNAMLSGSNMGAESQVRALVPQSAMGNFQKLKEWLINDPQGTNQQAFISRMLGSIEREKATASDQIKRTQMERVARYADLEKSNPDNFYNTLQAAGIEPDEYKAWKKGGFKRQSAVQGAEGNGPAVGTVKNGYKFKGGNPADKNSWEKQ